MNAAAEDHKRWTCLRSLIPPILARLRELKEASRRDAIAARRWDAPGADPPTPAEDPTAEYIGQEWIGDAMRVARELESLGFASDAEFLRQQTEFGRPGFSTPTELEAVHNIATLLARHTPEGDWCVSQDGLTPIAEAVHKIADPHPADIVKWLREGDLYSPLSELRSVLNKSWVDPKAKSLTSTRHEMVRRWLQTNGYEPAANECESRLTKLIEELDSWQSEAHYIAHGRVEWKTKSANCEFVELADLFGDDRRDWLSGLTEQAEDTWSYLRQLDSTIRTKLAAQLPDDEAEPTKPTGGKRATVNERMAGTIMENPEAMGWNSPQWAKHLKCGKSSVVETATWKKLESARLQAKAERMKDRRRKPKASDSRRD